MSMIHAAPVHAAEPVSGIFGRWFAVARETFAGKRTPQGSVRDINRMSDRELADIGMSRFVTSNTDRAASRYY